jgi:hypothetical protein
MLVKCRVMHFGDSVLDHKTYIVDDIVSGNRVELEDSKCERDLGVLISSVLRWKNHIDIIVSKAN